MTMPLFIGPVHETLLASTSTFHLCVLKRVDKRSVHSFFWEFISSYHRLEEEKNFLDSSYDFFGCFQYQLVVDFSSKMLSRSEIF